MKPLSIDSLLKIDIENPDYHWFDKHDRRDSKSTQTT